MDVTAVILTPSAETHLPATPGIEQLVRVVMTDDMSELLDARLEAVRSVRTKWWFFLDADDELPSDVLDVIAEGIEKAEAAGYSLAYTNELVRSSAGEYVWRPGPYDWALHRDRPLMLHHLVLAETSVAIECTRAIPRGPYWCEHLLFCEMGKRGAVYVDRVGHIWNKGDGLHRSPHTGASQVRSVLWHKEASWR